MLLVAALLMCPALTHSQPAKTSSRPASLKWGTTSVGSSVYVMTVGMADFLQKKTGIHISCEAVGGSDANVRAFTKKGNKINISTLSAWSAMNAYLGIRQFAKEAKVPLRILLQGQDSISNIIVRNDSGIKTPFDLKGKKFIGIRPASTDLEATVLSLLKAYGIPKESVKLLQTAEAKEALEALKIGTVDGAIIQGGVGAANIQELAQTTSVTFLPIPDDKLEMIVKELGPALHKATIPANTYKGQTKAVSFVSKAMTITAMNDFPDDIAYEFTKILLENPEELTRMHSVGKEWDVKTTLQPPPVPFHPGAIRYFKEKGYWNSSLENAQTKLLDIK